MNAILIWILRILASVILLQTLYFKFTAAPESVYIFSTMGMEPGGRILTGILELLAAILLLWPRFTAWGALLGAGLMCGALLAHFTLLGIAVMGDGGLLFIYACTVLSACTALLALVKINNPAMLFFRRFIQNKSV